MNDFTAIMRERSNGELLAITTTQRGDYQPEALQAAELELKSRGLTVEQMAAAEQELRQILNDQTRKKDERQRVENKLSDLADSVHPFTGSPTDKTIKILTMVLALGFMFLAWQDRMMWVYILEGEGDVHMGLLPYFVIRILMVIGIYGFWRIRKYGWVILTMLMTYLGFNTFISLAMVMKVKLMPGDEFTYSGLDSIYDGPFIASEVIQFVLFVAIFLVLNRSGIMTRYGIDRRVQLLAIGLTAPFILLWLTQSFI